MTIIDALTDKNLFAPWFKGDTWLAWQVVLKATFGIPLTKQELQLFGKYTQRNTAPRDVRELWLLVGRRGGKSMIAALIATYLAFFLDWKKVLTPGEHGVGMIICPDRRQGRVVMGYITGFIENTPLLKSMVERRTQESLYLKNGIIIEIHTASFRTIRGYTVAFAVCDEIAFWRSEDSANPDKEILNALRPAMATVPTSLLACISTPYSRRGALWDTWRRYYGQAGPVLVWQASSRAMNPTLPQRVIQQAYEQDPAAAAAEYDAQFRRDIEGFVSREAVEAIVATGRHELPPVHGTRYCAFVDPSGGSRDSMTLAVAHKEDSKTVLDAVRERRPPFSPEAVVVDFAQLMNSYRIDRVFGDRYGGEWPREQFRKQGIAYEVAEKTKSDLYRDLLPAINSGQLELLDHPRLINQLCGLERRTARSGRDSIDHAPGLHDNVAFAADDGTNGRELWRSDGTLAGTVLVKDILPGAASSLSLFLFARSVNGKYYFAADDGVNGVEPWVSDGTAAGTIPLGDLEPGPGDSLSGGNPEFIFFDGFVFFAAFNSGAGEELWRTDGTAAGTFQFQDICAGSCGSNLTGFTFLNPLVFAADDGSNGQELWILPEASVGPATFTVNSTADQVDAVPGDGQCATGTSTCTLRSAIQEANTLAGGDTINLPAGTYTLTLSGAFENNAATGDLDVTDTLTINGAGKASTIIDGNTTDRVIEVTGGGVIFQLTGVTVRNGHNSSSNGGGIFATDSTVIVTDSTITANHASGGSGNWTLSNVTTDSGGGGISNISGNWTLTDVTIDSNTAGDGDGGGIDSTLGSWTLSNVTIDSNIATDDGGGIEGGSGSWSLIDVTISNNSASTGGGISSGGVLNVVDSFIVNNTATGDGGGIDNGGDLTLTNTTVDGNSSSFSGGLFLCGNTTTIANSTISNNAATGGGAAAAGGIWNECGTLVVSNASITGNTSTDDGGGINNEDVLDITDSTISNNTAAVYGGGIFSDSNASSLSLNNVTMSDNTAADGGGIFYDGGSGPATAKNTIIANNPSGGDCSGPVVSLGNNLDSDNSCGLVSAGDLPNTNPLLGPLQNNGGPTFTHALLPGSPAIDAGDNSSCSAADQRGILRPQGPVCDIGAFESTGSSGSPGDGNGDGITDVLDLVVCVEALEIGYLAACDTNGDGEVDLNDIVEIVVQVFRSSH